MRAEPVLSRACRSSSRTISTPSTTRRPAALLRCRTCTREQIRHRSTTLFKAGAIIIGKTNMHELAFGITSTNLSSFAGPVKNPYDKTRIPGGSSGGTAAAIAAGIVTCGLGTDTGGSTRIPAALTGTVGLRPSVGNGGAATALQRSEHGGPDQPHPRYRRPDGPHGRRRGAAGFGDHRHADGHSGAAARQTFRHSGGVLERAGPRR